MADDIEVRRVAAGDQDALGRLWLAFLEEQASLDERVVVSDDALARWMNDFTTWIERDQRHMVVATMGTELIGFASGTRHAPPPIFAFVRELYVEELYVAPSARRRGVGKALYDGLIQWGTSWGAERVRLAVLAANQDARGFWQRLGLLDLSISMSAALEGASVPEERSRSRIGFGV